MKLKKYGFKIILFTTIIIISHGSVAISQPKDITDKKLVIVNDVAITENDLQIEFKRIKYQSKVRKQFIDDNTLEQAREKILNSLINRELLFQDSATKGITVGMDEIDASIQELRDGFYSGKSLEDILAEMNISAQIFTEQIKRDLSIRKLLETTLYSKISVSEKESKIFFDNNPNYFKKPEEVKASHILIKADPNADDKEKMKLRQKAENILKQIHEGGDFAALAKQFSEGPSSVNGGDLGYFDRKRMVKPFSDAAFSLEPGQVSEIVQTEFGYHIIKVFDKKAESKFEYDDIKDRLKDLMRTNKIQKETLRYLDELKKSADIQHIPQ